VTTDIKSLKSIGPRRAAAFKRIGVNTAEDLLSYYPRAYEDRTIVYPISGLEDGQSRAFCAEIAEQVRVSRIHGGLTLYKTTARDATGRVNLIYFNASYVVNALTPGRRFLFYGKAARNGNILEINSPETQAMKPGSAPKGSIVPVYPLTEGLTRTIVSAAVRNALETLGAAPNALETPGEALYETLPPQTLAEHKLAGRLFSIENMHLPKSFQALERARHRLIFEELFYLSLGLAKIRASRAGARGIIFNKPDFNAFYRTLPYAPTSAQMRAIGEAARDMSSGLLMKRLVQGDVGSGKTLVAAALAWMAARNGYQTAVMAPTEILASQHYETFSRLLAPHGVECALLTGGLGAAAKREAKAAALSESVNVLIGTHALLSDDVAYRALGLVVCDEQHRFGVGQRNSLTAKSDNPHALIMSATPIPRTLGLTIYGDLDLSILDESPPGRQNIDTFCVDEKMRPRIEAFVRKQVNEGRQVYIICHLIEGGDPDVKSVETYAGDLISRAYGDLRVGVLHGRMRPLEKDRIMNAFNTGAIDILVSTTVVEVGVDNPNASLIIIENAERFGLSQLHQLRGRVGRGGHKSYCVLFCGGGGETARERMEILCKTNDGFAVAEKDLELRGPGDFFGFKQHGLPGLKLASITADMAVLKEAQAAAAAVLERDPELAAPEHGAVVKKLEELYKEAAAGTPG